jgi:hypothetical protein
MVGKVGEIESAIGETRTLSSAYGSAEVAAVFAFIDRANLMDSDQSFKLEGDADPTDYYLFLAPSDEGGFTMHFGRAWRPDHSRGHFEQTILPVVKAAGWAIRQLRFEIGVDATPPEALPFKLIVRE